MHPILRYAAFCAALAAAPALAQEEIRTDGPAGPLGGALILPDRARHIAVIVRGSGPTDRDGNSGRGLRTDAYKLLARSLGENGIATIRIDKRGMYSSASEETDPNDVTVADYAADIRAWAAAAAGRAGLRCAWVLGHSEGGLMALAAADGRPATICGLVLVSAPGRPLGDILREQLRANPANGPYLEGAFAAIDRLERGQPAGLPWYEFTLRRLFPKAVQPYLIDLFAHDPAAMIAALDLPILIVQGRRDIQITEADAVALKAARPDAELILLDRMNHVLRDVASTDRAANARTYTNPELPLSPDLVPELARFMQSHE